MRIRTYSEARRVNDEARQRWIASGRSLDVVSDMTGYDAGDRFSSPEDVRAYFQPREHLRMFGRQAVTAPDLLREWAETVIARRSHCAF